MKKYLSVILLLFLFACGKDPTHYPSGNNSPREANQYHKRYKNIIFMIGDGMGLTQVSGASFVNGNFLNIERCKYIGLIKTQSADNYITESAASATAFATGIKTNNQYVAVDPEGNPVSTIVELLENKGLSTGVITTSYICDATPAAFFAHNISRVNHEEIALDLISTDIDFIAGGGQIHFDQRVDGLNLIDTMITNGYDIYYHIDSTEIGETTEKVAVIIAEVRPPSIQDGRGDFLPDATLKALELLSKNENGFFMMVEGAQIDWAMAEWDNDKYLEEMWDFDRAVKVAMDFADEDQQTLVVITGDHEAGGLSFPDGSLTHGTIEMAYSTDYHTGCMVPVFAYGPGAVDFTGIYENNDLFFKFKTFFNLK